MAPMTHIPFIKMLYKNVVFIFLLFVLSNWIIQKNSTIHLKLDGYYYYEHQEEPNALWPRKFVVQPVILTKEQNVFYFSGFSGLATSEKGEYSLNFEESHSDFLRYLEMEKRTKLEDCGKFEIRGDTIKIRVCQIFRNGLFLASKAEYLYEGRILTDSSFRIDKIITPGVKRKRKVIKVNKLYMFRKYDISHINFKCK